MMEDHLVRLRQKHPSVRFLKISADKAPFLTQKFSIKALPTVLIFKKGGQCIDGLLGFEDLVLSSGDGDCTTEALERRLGRCGIWHSLR